MPHRALLVLIVALFPLTPTAPSAASMKPVVIAYANAWAPMSEGDGGAVTGILPKLMDRLIVEKMGRPVVHLGLPWGRAQSAVRSGSVDAFVTTPTQARLDYATRSRNVVYPLQFRAFTLRNSVQSSALQAGAGVDDLGPVRICDVLGNGWAERFYRGLDRPVFWAPEIEHCLRMLAMGRTDLVVHSTAVTRLKISRLGLEPIIQMHPRVYPGSEFTLLISNASALPDEFLTEFDRQLDRLKDRGDYERLVDDIVDSVLSHYSATSLPR